MLTAHGRTLFLGSSQKSAAGEVVRAAQQAAGALVNSEHRLFGQEGGFTACDGEVVSKVVAHVLELEGLEVGAADDAGSEGP